MSTVTETLVKFPPTQSAIWRPCLNNDAAVLQVRVLKHCRSTYLTRIFIECDVGVNELTTKLFAGGRV